MGERAEKVAEARKLREQGLSYREIEAEVGIPRATLCEALNPAVKKRRYERLMTGECSRCGGSMSRSWDGGVCQSCLGDDFDRRARQVERLWAEGRSLKEIAVEMGWSVGCLGGQMATYRSRGYHLPYRRPRKNRPRFPKQVAR